MGSVGNQGGGDVVVIARALGRRTTRKSLHPLSRSFPDLGELAMGEGECVNEWMDSEGCTIWRTWLLGIGELAHSGTAAAAFLSYISKRLKGLEILSFICVSPPPDYPFLPG